MVIIFIFLHSYKTSDVVFIFVVISLAILDRITQAVKEVNSGILVVGVGKRVHAVNNVCA